CFSASRTTRMFWPGITPSRGPTRISWQVAATSPNRLGFAVQLALLRHLGMGLAQMEEPVDVLVEWLAARLKIPAAAFADYAGRPQTMTDHALVLATTLGLRSPSNADLPFMIEAAAQSAWSTDRGSPIVAGVIAALRTAKIILPVPAV